MLFEAFDGWPDRREPFGMSFPDEGDRERVDGLAHQLVEEGLLEPVARDPREEEHWAAFDLASLVEIRLGETISPEEAASARETWAPRVESKQVPRIDRAFGAPYWVVSGGSRVGTSHAGRSSTMTLARDASSRAPTSSRRDGAATGSNGRIGMRIARGSTPAPSSPTRAGRSSSAPPKHGISPGRRRSRDDAPRAILRA